ncbi:MAG TPA: WYL domain-containing protein, partial [Polyangiaceae bacterium]|nr:WYL domain-containing protein [Polyangiaceae bacterium]
AMSPPTGENRGRKVIRHRKLLSCLARTARGLTAEDLLHASGDKCSMRTVFRDLSDLQAAGFALASDDGRWSLDQGVRIHAPIEPDELLALVLAEQSIAAGGATAHAAPLATLRSKLLAAVTPQTRAYCDELRHSAVATAFAPNVGGALEPIASAIQDAIGREHVLAMTYETPGKPAARRFVEPYATWIANGRPYLVGFCRTANEVRTFALARVLAAEVLDEDYDIDPSFNVADYVGKGVGVYHGAVHEIVLVLAAEVAHLARERTLHRTQTVEPLMDGRALLRIQAAGLPEVAAWVASFGGNVRAVEPPELVEMVRTPRLTPCCAAGPLCRSRRAVRCAGGSPWTVPESTPWLRVLQMV